MNAAQNFTVALPHFEGPLELLLSLIERRELEITELSLSQVTGDYLATVTALEKAHADDLRWFLEIGSKLVAHKTRAIRHDNSEAEEDSQNLADLTEELERYQAWRSISRRLQAQFGTTLPVRPAKQLNIQAQPKNLNLSALTSAWRSIAAQGLPKAVTHHKVTITRADIGRTMQKILFRVANKQSLEQTISSQDRRTKTLSLLALLELIKQDLVELVFEPEGMYVQAT